MSTKHIRLADVEKLLHDLMRETQRSHHPSNPHRAGAMAALGKTLKSVHALPEVR